MNMKKKYKIICIVCILIIFVLLIGLGIKNKKISEYEKKVDKITEIDYEERQRLVNTIVEEGTMNVNYSSRAVFEGTRSVLFNVKNIENNHYPIVFEIIDENKEIVYVSKKIEPGYELNHIELQNEMSKGIHECQIRVGYAEEGNVASVFPITIEVR